LGRDGDSDVAGAAARDNPRAYAAVVVMACKRLDYLQRTVQSIKAGGLYTLNPVYPKRLKAPGFNP
jgi:hypothetical protein